MHEQMKEQCGLCPIADWSDQLQIERERLSNMIYGPGGLGVGLMGDRAFRDELKNESTFSPELVAEVKSVFSELVKIMQDDSLSEAEAYEATAVFAERFNLRVNELAEVVAMLSEELRLTKIDAISTKINRIDSQLAIYNMSTLSTNCEEGSRILQMKKSMDLYLQCGSLAINEDQRMKMSLLIHDGDEDDE